MNICIVADPSDVVRRVVSHLLAPHGYLTLEAGTGREALQAFANEAPQLVFVDRKLTDMDSMDVIRAIHEARNDATTRIVLLTAIDDPAVWSKALASGADAQLIKPFTELEMRDLIACTLTAA